MIKIEWGFDLTDFKSVETFNRLLNRFNLKGGKKVKSSGNDSEIYEFQWKNPSLLLVTTNNPITGEHSLYPNREIEKGYASYIGIEGEEKQVKELADYIRKNASIKNESKYSRDYI